MPLNQIVPTTPDFRAGQEAAWRDHEKDPESTPNYALLARLKSDEFAAGYRYEYDEYIAPRASR